MSVITKELAVENITIRVTNFPVEVCSECGDYTTSLLDGVKAELYARDILQHDHVSKDVEVDFSDIFKTFEGKDITEEIMLKKHD